MAKAPKLRDYKQDATVSVFSASANQWFEGTVTGVDAPNERITVQYVNTVTDVKLTKALGFESPNLRLLEAPPTQSIANVGVEQDKGASFLGLKSPTVPLLEPPTIGPSQDDKKYSYITLEVYYSREVGAGGGRDPFRSARPYLREAVALPDRPGAGSITFRSFLRHGLFEKRPELKYRDDDIIFFQTPKGTNLLSLLDEPIGAALPELLAQAEQRLLRVIVKSGTAKAADEDDEDALVDIRDKLTYRTPHGRVPAWPVTRLEEQEGVTGIPEEDSVHAWAPRAFKLDDFSGATPDGKRRRTMVAVVALLVVAAIACAATLAALLPRADDVGPLTAAVVAPTLAPTRSPVTGRPTRPSKLQLLTEAVSRAAVPGDLRAPSSPERRALEWLAERDGADLASDLCSAPASPGAIVVQSDDDGFGRRRRTRGLRRRRREAGRSGGAVRRRVADENATAQADDKEVAVKAEDEVAADADDEFVVEADDEFVLEADENEADDGCHDDARLMRRYALAVLYFATMDLPVPTNPNAVEKTTDDDDGGNTRRRTRHASRRVEWTEALNFLSDEHECAWHRRENRTTEGGEGGGPARTHRGVVCTNGGEEGDEHVVLLDEGGQPNNSFIGAIALRMSDNQLTGKLPPVLFQIQNLKEVRLANNTLTGEVFPAASPTAYHGNSSVEHLDLRANNLTGTLGFLLRFPAATEVRLDGNRFRGPVPAALGRLAGLRVLTLGGNALDGTMPEEVCGLRREGALKVLEADCGGPNPRVECDCCTSCSTGVD